MSKWSRTLRSDGLGRRAKVTAVTSAVLLALAALVMPAIAVTGNVAPAAIEIDPPNTANLYPGSASVDCYRAGVDAWRRTHPDQSAEYAAKQAVAVILAAKVSLRVEE